MEKSKRLIANCSLDETSSNFGNVSLRSLMAFPVLSRNDSVAEFSYFISRMTANKLTMGD